MCVIEHVRLVENFISDKNEKKKTFPTNELLQSNELTMLMFFHCVESKNGVSFSYIQNLKSCESSCLFSSLILWFIVIDSNALNMWYAYVRSYEAKYEDMKSLLLKTYST